MNICAEFKRKIIDYIENQLIEHEHKKFKEHLQYCEQCQSEYSRVKRLYEVLDKDEVILPENEFFENLRTKVRQKKIVLRRFNTQKIMRIFVPVLAAAAAILLLLNRPSRTVEITVPMAALLDDKEIASLGLGGVINEELINDLLVVEEYISSETDETIDELTEEEQVEFIESLYKKYGINI